MLRILQKRLSRVEAKLKERIGARQALNANQILHARIESIAVRLAAAGYTFPETGPAADAARSYVQERLTRVLELAKPC